MFGSVVLSRRTNGVAGIEDPPKTKTSWQKAAGKDRGAQLNEEASLHFARVDRCYRVILGRIATALVAKLSDDLDEVLADYSVQARCGCP